MSRFNSSKKVYKYSLEGEYLAEFPSGLAAASHVDIAFSAVSRCVNGHQKTCGGFQWRSEKHDKIPPVDSYRRGKGKGLAAFVMTNAEIDRKLSRDIEVKDCGIVENPTHREYGKQLVRIGKTEIYFRPDKRTLEEVVNKYHLRHAQHNRPRNSDK